MFIDSRASREAVLVIVIYWLLRWLIYYIDLGGDINKLHWFLR